MTKENNSALTCSKRGKATAAYYHPDHGWIGYAWSKRTPLERKRRGTKKHKASVGRSNTK